MLPAQQLVNPGPCTDVRESQTGAEAPAKGVAFLGSTSVDGREKQARTDHKAHSTTSISKKFLFPRFHTLKIYANLNTKQSGQEKC